MRSRDPGLLATSFNIAERVPFWAVLAIAVVAFMAFDLLAHIAVPTASRAADAGPMVIRQMLKTCGEILRFVIPSALILGTLVSYVRKRTRRRGLDKLQSGNPDIGTQHGDSDLACPRCASPMRQRTAKSGPRGGRVFLGCSRYPVCKGTREVAP